MLSQAVTFKYPNKAVSFRQILQLDRSKIGVIIMNTFLSNRLENGRKISDTIIFRK